jgi:hypothetical protein
MISGSKPLAGLSVITFLSPRLRALYALLFAFGEHSNSTAPPSSVTLYETFEKRVLVIARRPKADEAIPEPFDKP